MPKGFASLKGLKVKTVFETYRDNHIHIVFTDGTHLHMEFEGVFDEDGNHLVRDTPLLTNQDADFLLRKPRKKIKLRSVA
jgi:hypothetical protein